MSVAQPKGRLGKRGAALPNPSDLHRAFVGVRSATLALLEPLSAEDCLVQSMPDVSPSKWHAAHVTWFFETFVLKPREGYAVFDPSFEVLFNSYYNSVGAQYPRAARGLISRPGLERVLEYRRHVDAALGELLEAQALSEREQLLVEVGLHHEQQHQELLLMDIKHVFSVNPAFPAYRRRTPLAPAQLPAVRWVEHPGGEVQIGHDPAAGFSFDNETPRHSTLLRPFELASRVVTNGEWLEFVRDRGYASPLLWLSDGWSTVQRESWRAPLYWVERDGAWFEHTLGGLVPLQLDSPVVHVSYYEADAYASWAGARLPAEAEWEAVAAAYPIEGNFVEHGSLHPLPAVGESRITQLYGDVWELTQSPYGPYPGFRAAAGALGEYNGKFMCNQVVLRGGCCVTPRSHMRTSYRNFFYPHQRWAFSGLRLARDML